jgi:ASC-1-like (ASCH) protein
MKIEKKLWPEYFEKVKTGDKKYEIRLADFKIKPNDKLILKEWDPKTEEYTGREVIKKVSYVLKTKDIEVWAKKVWGQKNIKKFGYQIISLE